jgi:serpin B
MLTKAGIDRSVITQVKQNAFTTVNEDGTIVAAITALSAIALNGSTPNYPTINVNVNHPFLFFVRNNVTGSILMAGRVCNIM